MSGLNRRKNHWVGFSVFFSFFFHLLKEKRKKKNDAHGESRTPEVVHGLPLSLRGFSLSFLPVFFFFFFFSFSFSFFLFLFFSSFFSFFFFFWRHFFSSFFFFSSSSFWPGRFQPLSQRPSEPYNQPPARVPPPLDGRTGTAQDAPFIILDQKSIFLPLLLLSLFPS